MNTYRRICLCTTLAMGCADLIGAAEVSYRIALANALSGGHALVDLSVIDDKFTGGDVGIAPADVTALVRDGNRLHGRVACVLDGQPCWFDLDLVVRDGTVVGKYNGARGDTKMDGAATGTVATAALPPSPENPVGWRGNGGGVFAFTDPPTQWAPGEWPPGATNIRWRTKMEGWGNAQPIVVSNRLFVFNEPTTMVCLDADTGEVIWKKDLNVLWALKGEEFTKYWAMWQERQQKAEGMDKGDAAAAARLKELDAVLSQKVQLFGDGCQERYLKGYTGTRLRSATAASST